MNKIIVPDYGGLHKRNFIGHAAAGGAAGADICIHIIGRDEIKKAVWRGLITVYAGLYGSVKKIQKKFKTGVDKSAVHWYTNQVVTREHLCDDKILENDTESRRTRTVIFTSHGFKETVNSLNEF
ncbi:MAG: hypothetical protein IJE71_07270 [Clostridia bacterium]|nr:hypothetical protein [Clostridia bacterium]